MQQTHARHEAARNNNGNDDHHDRRRRSGSSSGGRESAAGRRRCADKTQGGCGQPLPPSLFSFSLQHIRFEGAPLLCDTCASLVPPTPQLDEAAQQEQELRTLWTIHRVGVRVRSKRGLGAALTAPEAIAISAAALLVAPPPLQQSTPKRKKSSRGSAIVAAAAPASLLATATNMSRTPQQRVSTPAQSPSGTPNRISANASWVLQQCAAVRSHATLLAPTLACKHIFSELAEFDSTRAYNG